VVVERASGDLRRRCQLADGDLVEGACPELLDRGDATVALTMPGTDVQRMLDAHDPDAPVGPLFVVDSMDQSTDSATQ
jgi:hypothetical protein